VLVACSTGTSSAATFGGDLTAATDYIFRGISQNNGHPVAQFDLHGATNTGNYFAGMWGSTLKSSKKQGNFELQFYAGRRWQLSNTWSAAVTGLAYIYLHETPDEDYQELSGSLSYLDQVTIAVAATPNAVRYKYGYRVGRYPAYSSDVTAQWPIYGDWFLVGGAGYYYITGPDPPDTGPSGYGYGNVGLAFEHRAWRLDGGYFFSSSQAKQLAPYSAEATNRWAASLTWRF
jgi:uncharacterized protein (TIGR02001 family)